MSDPTTPTPNPEKPGAEREASDLVGELRELGQQLESAFRAFVESDRAKQLQQDLARSAREVSNATRDAVKNVQTDPRFQTAEQRGREALNQARESQVMHDLQEALVNGLAQLNVQLRRVVERLETERAGGTPVQQVPIEHEPATGETRKLDE